jgi:nucleoside-diphosphate-sugar epimerase
VVDFCAYEPSDVEMLLQNVPGSVQQYIYFSTCTVYQDSVHIPMAEDSPKLTGPLPGPHGDYGYKKWLAELKLEELSKKKSMAYTILRPAFIYGKYNYAPRESYFFELIKEQKPIIVPSLPQALFTIVSVWDVANITIACLGNKKVFDNAFNLSAEELISYDKLVEVLQEITSSSFKVQRLGIAQIYAQGIPLPYPLTQHLVYSGALIQEVLNYQYMPFLEGMTKTYKHYFNI